MPRPPHRARLSGTAARLVLALLVVAGAAPAPAAAGVVLVRARWVLENRLPPLLPLPDGGVVGTTALAQAAASLPLAGDDLLLYDAASGAAARFGDTTTLSLDALGAQFARALAIADPATLLYTPFAAQDATLAAVLDRPGTLVMVDVGPAGVPAGALAVGAAERPPLPAPPCPGDCNTDRRVTIDEIVRAVGIALGLVPVAECAAADADGGGAVTINEIIAAVARALDGCAPDT